MLKIKDKISLKELEKYGFELEGEKYIKYSYHKFWYFGYISVSTKDRIVTIYTENDYDVVDDTIYDLIKADLVEKVEENKERERKVKKDGK